MPSFSCQVGDLTTDATCSDSGGLLTVFVADSTDIDWVTMENVLNWDDANFTIILWAVTGEFFEYGFERRNGRLDGTYTTDDGFYAIQLLNMLFKGHSSTKTLAIGRTVSCCGLVAQIHDNNDLARVAGKEHISGSWVDPLSKLKVTRHLDTHGAFGTADDTSRDELDFGAEQSHPMVYSSVSIADMRLL